MATSGGLYKTVDLHGADTTSDTIQVGGTPDGSYISGVIHVSNLSGGGSIVLSAQVYPGTDWVAIQTTNLNDGTEAASITADGLYGVTLLGIGAIQSVLTGTVDFAWIGLST